MDDSRIASLTSVRGMSQHSLMLVSGKSPKPLPVVLGERTAANRDAGSYLKRVSTGTQDAKEDA